MGPQHLLDSAAVVAALHARPTSHVDQFPSFGVRSPCPSWVSQRVSGVKKEKGAASKTFVGVRTSARPDGFFPDRMLEKERGQRRKKTAFEVEQPSNCFAGPLTVAASPGDLTPGIPPAKQVREAGDLRPHQKDGCASALSVAAGASGGRLEK